MISTKKYDFQDALNVLKGMLIAVEKAYRQFVTSKTGTLTLEELTVWRGRLEVFVSCEVRLIFGLLEVREIARLFEPFEGIVICESNAAYFDKADDELIPMYLEFDYRKAGLTAIPHDLAQLFLERYRKEVASMLVSLEDSGTFGIVHPAFKYGTELSEKVAAELCTMVDKDGWTCTSEQKKRGETCYWDFTFS